MDEKTRTVIRSYYPGVNHFEKLPDPVISRTNQVVIEYNINGASFSSSKGEPIFNISYHVFKQFEGKFILYMQTYKMSYSLLFIKYQNVLFSPF